jgi:hypothetical protein
MCWLQEHFGGVVSTKYSPTEPLPPHRKQIYTWRLFALVEINWVIQNSISYMIIKRAHAEIMLKYTSSRLERGKVTYGEQDNSRYEQIRLLNAA